MRHLRAFARLLPAKRLFPDTLKHLLLAFTLCLFLAAAVGRSSAATPAHFWGYGFGGTGTDDCRAVAVDASGNVVIAGSFVGGINLGGSTLTSAGSGDIFIAKYDASGAHLWSQRFGSATDDAAKSVAIDAAGNVLVTGVFGGTTDFGGGGLVSAGALDIFLAKYSAAGTHVWSKRFGSTGFDTGAALAVDANSSVVVTGWFAATVDFGGGNLVSAGSSDAFMASYNSAGTHAWSKRFGSTVADEGRGIAVDASNNVFVTGSFQGTVDFGGGNLNSAGGPDVFAANYNVAGTHQWSQRFGAAGNDAGYSVAIDGAGNLLVSGHFSGTVSFGGSNLVSAGSVDIFLAKYTGVGVHLWSKGFGSITNDVGYAVAVDEQDNVFATGTFNGTVNFGGDNLVSNGFDGYLAKYDPTGVHQWSSRVGNSGTDNGFMLDCNQAGNVLVVGNFSVSIDLGGGTIPSVGTSDVFIVKYGALESEPPIASIADIGNDQGRQVKISFRRSGRDDPEALSPVIRYEAYRRNDAPPALMATRDLAGMSSRQLMDQGWTEVGSVNGHGMSEYSIDVPTIGDSTLTLGPYNSTFFIRGASANSFDFFDSPPDSGYSLDNLAPSIPQNFVFDTDNLTWDESTAADFDFFTVYGSNTDSFGAAIVVDYSVAPELDVNASPYTFYYVTATDFSGNEGKPAKVNTLSGVGGSPKSYVLSVSNYPNPFNPRTTVSYTVPSRGNVSISIYDTRGALVATLFNGDRSAGAYTMEWDGRGQSGTPVSTGVYFARIEHTSGTRSKKMVLLK